MSYPPFGTSSAYNDSFPTPPPRQVTISAETCYQMGAFKNMVKQYRRLDDQIITRLNRAQAQLRDQSRISGSEQSSDMQGMCLNLWHEMMAGWAHRQTMLSFCLQTVARSMEGKRPVEPVASTPAFSSPMHGASARGWAEEEVLANQLGNEESIEAIIRKRSLDAFKSRCPFFHPPDNTGKEWWNLADSGMSGRGPDVQSS
ncbi:caffeine-induced death protein 2-domain-containing protein [Kockovaella imperatae]|uniref:Caffeine-induced death protein 2-domain-containing protein n=1 Tax=Kockovaella imperatae TaxID=4999 RepID=A0A1Y1U8Y0_9TREE|nr:caffeine-induced death protein 2-domain-containing protein [Kockovaella imperatae]ORX34499.1 caffeine-induced death protein 2-domain-containing protein [Kockovaella imperatae]